MQVVFRLQLPFPIGFGSTSHCPACPW